jgi:hypothetical protein
MLPTVVGCNYECPPTFASKAIQEEARKLERTHSCPANRVLVIEVPSSARCLKHVPSTSQPQPSTPLYSEEAAAAVAEQLLGAVPLPANTEVLAQPPASVASKLGRAVNSEGSAKSVDRYAFWLSSEPPKTLLSVVAAGDSGLRLEYSGYGETSGKEEGWSETLEAPVASPLAGPRKVFLNVVRDGAGRYAVRVDAVATWHRQRPAISLVPSSARWLEVRITAPAFRGFRGERWQVAHDQEEHHNDIVTGGRSCRARCQRTAPG